MPSYQSIPERSVTCAPTIHLDFSPQNLPAGSVDLDDLSRICSAIQGLLKAFACAQPIVPATDVDLACRLVVTQIRDCDRFCLIPGLFRHSALLGFSGVTLASSPDMSGVALMASDTTVASVLEEPDPAVREYLYMLIDQFASWLIAMIAGELQCQPTNLLRRAKSELLSMGKVAAKTVYQQSGIRIGFGEIALSSDGRLNTHRDPWSVHSTISASTEVRIKQYYDLRIDAAPISFEGTLSGIDVRRKRFYLEGVTGQFSPQSDARLQCRKGTVATEVFNGLLNGLRVKVIGMAAYPQRSDRSGMPDYVNLRQVERTSDDLLPPH
jgi:hypothetical protein